jgi:hypothetical protein
VNWLCRLWPNEAVPRVGERRSPLQEWLPAGVALETVPPLDGGRFWGNIRVNFVGDGRGALTTLNEEDRARVRALPWFGAALARLEGARQRRAAPYPSPEV